MIKINKGTAYLIGCFVTLLLYFAGQGLFFLNTSKTTGHICDITMGHGRRGYDAYYVCFTTKKGQQIKFMAGSYLPYDMDSTVAVIYSNTNPKKARLNTFKTLWLVPAIIYVIPFMLIMAVLTGVYYGTKYVIISRNPWKIYLSNDDEWII